MVLLHVKRGDESLFLWDTPATTPLGELVPTLVAAQNQCARVRRLVQAMEDLVEFGPYKPPAEHGYDVKELEAVATNETAATASKEPRTLDGRDYLYQADPTGRRTGYGPVEEVAVTMRATMERAMHLVSAKNPAANIKLEMVLVDQAVEELRAVVTIAYPMGLPEFDPVRECLDNTEDLSGSAASKEVYVADQTTLWWANKELVRGKTLADYVGRNEKTKIVAKLQKKGHGAPVREPAVDERMQKEMMAYYFKKQEEHKKLMENTEDDYLNSSWANSKSLKGHFNGMAGDVSWKPR